MYWLDGSLKPPFPLHCSYLLSRCRARKIYLAQDLIENQARVVKSCVKNNDFDNWCIAASELVELMIDLTYRDETYLQLDGMLMCDKSLCRILDLNSLLVNLVCFAMFELARSQCLTIVS